MSDNEKSDEEAYQDPPLDPSQAKLFEKLENISKGVSESRELLASLVAANNNLAEDSVLCKQQHLTSTTRRQNSTP